MSARRAVASTSSFYSLSCETYSGTSPTCCQASTSSFLFAVVRDVQRNWLDWFTPEEPTSFYSLSCETYSGTARPVHDQDKVRKLRFLFAVVRDVQRNLRRQLPDQRRLRVSIRCRARRTAEPDSHHGCGQGVCPVSIRCRARRTAEPEALAALRLMVAPRFYSLSCETYSRTRAGQGARRGGLDVSIRCRARRTAERSGGPEVFYNDDSQSFYSLSCETYSGTVTDVLTKLDQLSFYSLSCETYSGTTPRAKPCANAWMFLFAVVRDVQRNLGGRSAHPRVHGFYSLSCETYSGTSSTRTSTTPRASFLFAVVRDVQRNFTSLRLRPARAPCFYSLSCETYSGTASPVPSSSS